MISLVIPTYNRPQFLGRLLHYYSQVRFPHRIVVADSSDPETTRTNKELTASLEDVLQIDYRNFSSDTPFIAKLVQVLEELDTRYAVVCADDDFITAKGIEQASVYLEEHNDYSIASGRFTLVTAHSHPNGSPEYGLLSYDYSQSTINDADPSLRLRNHLKNYNPTFYAVHRRSNLLRNLQLTQQATSDYRFGELLPSCLSLIQGKAICVDALYMVRQCISDSATGKTKSWADLLTEDDFSERYALFCRCLITELVNTGGVSERDAIQTVDQSFQSYLSSVLKDNLSVNGISGNPGGQGEKVSPQVVQKLKRLVKTLPAAARAAFIEAQMLSMLKAPRTAYRQLQRKRDEMSVDALLDERSRFRADFLPIHECLGRYPNGIITPQGHAGNS